MTLATVVADDDVNRVGAGGWVDAVRECHPINKKKETTDLIRKVLIGKKIADLIAVVFILRITRQ
jgi:hypothetical protein